MSNNDRLTRLEESYTHLQKHVIEQDKVILELSDKLVRVGKDLAALRESDQPGGERAPGRIDERPPHY